MSYRPQLIAIISIAQQARPKVTGQIAERRAHWTTDSTVVVSTGISNSVSSPIAIPLYHRGTRPRRPLVVGIGLRPPVEDTLPPDVDVADQQDEEEDGDLDEAGPAELPERHRPRIEERDFDVEQQEDHGNQVELHRLPLAGVAD